MVIVVSVCFLGSIERSSTQSYVYKGPQKRGSPQSQPLGVGTRPTVLLDVPQEMRASIVSYSNRYNKYLRHTSTHEKGTFDPWGLVNRYVCWIAVVWRGNIVNTEYYKVLCKKNRGGIIKSLLGI